MKEFGRERERETVCILEGNMGRGGEVGKKRKRNEPLSLDSESWPSASLLPRGQRKPPRSRFE